MNIPLRVLIVEDSEDDTLLLLRALRHGGYNPQYERVETEKAMKAALDRQGWDVVIADYSLPSFSGIKALEVMKRREPDVPFIIVSGAIGEDLAVGAMKAGAQDYLMKDNLTRLAPAIGRELAEAEMRRSREKAQEQIRQQAALLDIAQDAIIVQDLEGRICFWNKSAERLYGWSAEEAIERLAEELLFGKTAPQMDGARQMLATQGEWCGELQQIAKSGHEVTVESRWKLIRDEKGHPRSIFVVNTDITEKKKLEAQFLRSQRLESIGTLASGIAHDLNNVLTPVLLALPILEQKLSDDSGKRILDMVETSVRRGADIVKQVLAFGRGLEGKHVQLQPRYLIKEIKKMIQETFPKSIEIVTEFHKNLWTISGDATQLEQVLLNLCVNARDAMPNGGLLKISAENVVLDENYVRMNIDAKVGSYVMITVSDTGTGIPEGILNKIFDPFFTTKEVGKGTGLGLSTAIAIVKSYGGFVNVYSEVGEGTCFKIYFPAIVKPEPKKKATKLPKLPTGNGELILVVDDEVSIREITQETLESFGYRVLGAQDGTEAVALYAQNIQEVQVVLTDMRMPYMDGVATIRALRKINPKLKIITTSGLTASRKIAKASGVNVQAFLPKPYTAERLLRLLHKVLKLK
ncbi:hybrid sensor histidine kinase/response regulator [Phormidium sp. CCY1219]|uniref:hybrid sensor histidine kinase/response regulator n=1 Tax=Phormidium sp. CCY1219 TaxID=2886104 RepID=UPI002D1F4989|nr:response regulator [Phormidium sp. CCY1219]MEB3827606.1 response regulator [Phormidium sp. CCY1219]